MLDYLAAGTIDMVINVPAGRQERADGYEIRAAATANSVPLITTIAEFAAAVTSLHAVREKTFGVRSLQDWSA
ncbi:carbamoyl phosphate synthase large subunit [Mycobacteroides abscessus subsp. abscessus]|nr:carbamoyl phosphate synthase large subunit [Mycobacteroides abscessus subsp. abscessus]